MTENESKITPNLLNKHQVATMLGVSKRTVTRLQNEGLLSVIRLGLRCVRYRYADVDNTLRKLTIKSHKGENS